MLNIHELETKWLHYKVKSYIPRIIISISSVIIIVIVYSLEFSTKENTETPVTIKNTTTKDTIKKEILPPVNEKTATTKVIVKNTKTLMSPSMDFMRTISSSSPKYYSTDTNKKIRTNKTENIKPIIKTEKPKETTKVEVAIVEVPKVEVVKTSAIKIKRRNTQEDIQHVISRFRKSNNPALSLFVAKKYYELKDYNQAYNYALITNELNNDIEESWIIFAKSLVKLNKKTKAIKILDRYIKHSHSHKAKLLLDNIRLGRMK